MQELARQDCGREGPEAGELLDLVSDRQPRAWGTGGRVLAGCCVEKVVARAAAAGRPVGRELPQRSW